jgi:hypothetical protein
VSIFKRSNRKRIIILGCGPAGLFAAHAAIGMGHDVRIISKLRKSEMYGAQYLHTSIPGLSDGSAPFKVEYRLEGDLDDYLHKVYGEIIPDRSAITVESLVGVYDAWNIRAAYDRAFELYWQMVVNQPVGASVMHSLIHEDRPDLIISTIPAPGLCLDPGHAFDSRLIWAIGDAPERGVFAPRLVSEPNVILYNGTKDTGYYRASNISGYQAVEWPHRTRPPLKVAEVVKPVRTTCVCWTKEREGTRLLRLGRYGAWNRLGHTHQAYWRTLEALKEL